MMQAKLYENNYVITSPFGPRNLDGDTRPHKGIDCVGLTSKNVLALTECTVLSSQIIIDKGSLTWEWGNYIKLDDGYGYYPHYCHLSKRLVVKGAKVTPGQVIGVEGQTGYSKGSHLHFEVRNKSGVSIDPMEYFEILKKRGVIVEVQKLTLEHQWQWDMLQEAVVNLRKASIITSDDWEKKITNKSITLDEISWLNAIAIKRLLIK